MPDPNLPSPSDTPKQPTGGRLMRGDRIARYEIVSLLGTGGAGEVYLAMDPELGRKVAIKVLNAAVADQDTNLQRFILEAKAASAINHPNILTLHEIVAHDGSCFIVSEFVDGKTLRQVLHERSLTVGESVSIAAQIAEAISAAHEQRIIHRDIKPENVIVRKDGYIKVLDFGLAKLLPPAASRVGLDADTVLQQHTAVGSIVGTVNYMSPEQARGEPLDERTDIFSLGVLIFEMVSGRSPFQTASVAETLANIIYKDPPSLNEMVPHAPPSLAVILSKALAKERQHRYQTMKALEQDLKGLNDSIRIDAGALATSPHGEEATAIHPQFTADSENPVIPSRKRRPLVWAGAALAGVLLLIGAGIGVRRYLLPGAQSEVRSLAVLPLRSLDSGDNYLGLGIADALIRRISQTGTLIVRPTSTVRKYLTDDSDALTAGRQLSVDAVLEGSVQRANDRLRVSVNLLRTSDGASLWTESFDMRGDDIFTIQDSLAQQVASRLRLKVDDKQKQALAKRATSSPEAYEYYLKAMFRMDQLFASKDKENIAAAIGFLEQAIEIDPDFALAHAQLAVAYATTALFIEPDQPEWVDKAKREIARAEAIDPMIADSHLANQLLLWSAYEGYQNEAAVRELLLAQSLDPNVGHASLAIMYAHMGLVDNAVREIDRGRQVDPTSELVKNGTVLVWWLTQDWDKWSEVCSSLADTDGCHHRPDYAWYLLSKGRLDEAQQLIDILIAAKPGAPEPVELQGLLLALRGQFADAEKKVPEILSKQPVRDPNYHHAAYFIGDIYALMGRSSDAVKWLKVAAETGYPNYPVVAKDKYLDHIRQSPEFVEFISGLKSQHERFTSEFH